MRGTILGRGAFGTVIKSYAKNDKTKEHPYAIKIINKDKMEDPDEMCNEIEILWTLDHPNIVKYHETYSDQHKMYLVMEYCPYGILDSQDGSSDLKMYTEDESKDLMRQLLQAMMHYNCHGIIHRDIKPDNIMIGEDGKPRFCDFGVSKKVSNKTTDKSLRTEVGTDLYKSPEVLLRKYDEKCDIWALAVVLYQMITCDMPFFPDQGLGALIKAIKQGNYKPMPEGTSTDIQDLIKNMLKVDVKQRFSAE